MYLHPYLFFNGLINIAYYTGEVLLYEQPLGIVLIVMAALTSSFVIQPLESVVGMVDTSVPVSIVFVGILGSLCCVLEKNATAAELVVSLSELYASAYASVKQFLVNLFCCVWCSTWWSAKHQPYSDPIDRDDDDDSSRAHIQSNDQSNSVAVGGEESRASLLASASTSSHRSLIRSLLSVGVPFTLLAASYSMWFVSQKLFNKNYRTNVFGYTSLDQCLAPIYMLSYLTIIESIGPLRRNLVAKEDQQETLKQAVQHTFKDYANDRYIGLWTVFCYRFLINARAMGYFYLGVIYDLDVVYLELTLTRVVLSWLMALVLCVFVPSFIVMTSAEKRTVFLPLNVTLKTFGTGLIVLALLLLN